MANTTATIEEVRFDLRDEQITHVYVLVRAGGDELFGVQGWHYKAFPARIPLVEILTPQHFEDYILWPLDAPETKSHYIIINADGDLSPEMAEALVAMGDLVGRQYAEQDKGTAIEDADYAEIATKELAEAFSRLQSEHSDLIERERVLEAEVAALRRQLAAAQTWGELQVAIVTATTAERDDLRRQLAECQAQLAKRHDGDWSMLIEE